MVPDCYTLHRSISRVRLRGRVDQVEPKNKDYYLASARYGLVGGTAGLCLTLVPIFLAKQIGCLFTCGAFLCSLGICFEIGRWAAERTGVTKAGVLSGALVGLLCGIGLGISGPIITLRSPDFVPPPGRGAVLAVSIALEIILFIGVLLGAGAGLGWYGALLGQKQRRNRLGARVLDSSPQR